MRQFLPCTYRALLLPGDSLSIKVMSSESEDSALRLPRDWNIDKYNPSSITLASK